MNLKRWSQRESELLVRMANEYRNGAGRIKWNLIYSHFANKTPNQLKRQYNNIKQRYPEMLLDVEIDSIAGTEAFPREDSHSLCDQEANQLIDRLLRIMN